MLPKRRRLSAAEVSEVIKHGRSVRGTLVSIKYVAKQGFFRAAVVAPKAVARKAVERNRLRRALYAALEGLPKDSFQGLTAVFFIRAIPPSPMAPALRHELSLLAKKTAPHVSNPAHTAAL
jgi:ribonuclease P protein component